MSSKTRGWLGRIFQHKERPGVVDLIWTVSLVLHQMGDEEGRGVV